MQGLDTSYFSDERIAEPLHPASVSLGRISDFLWNVGTHHRSYQPALILH